jgi:uncharacterized protein (UPF0332 family)
MNISRLFSDKKYLAEAFKFFKEKQQIEQIKKNPELVNSYLEKSKHNLAFFKLNQKYSEYLDWQIVALYYSLYHTCLALITNKNYFSKNHTATILILIKEYSISEKEAELINKLSIKKEEAQLYNNLKRDRQDASYSTNTKFTKKQIEDYFIEVTKFLNKAEEIIRQ